MLQLQTNNIVRTQRQVTHENMQQDEALSILNDFNEILQSEVYVDLERLRILARHGIPSELRGVNNENMFINKIKKRKNTYNL